MTVTGHSGDTPGQTPNATNTATSLHHILHQGNMRSVSVVARVVIGGLGVAELFHVYSASESGRMPMMLGEADAKYWGSKHGFMRVANLCGLALFGALFIVAAIVA